MWHKEKRMLIRTHEFDGFRYIGTSVGSEQTCHGIPSFDLMIDVGGCPVEVHPIENCFITHGHGDHISGLIKQIPRRINADMSAGNYWAPPEIVPGLKHLVAGWNMTRGALPRLYQDTIHPIELHQIVEINKRNVMPIRATHRGPSYAYRIFERRKRLRQEFRHLDQSELRKLAQQKIDLSEVFDANLAFFSGDTTTKILDLYPEIIDAPIVFFECTSFDSEISPDETRKSGHTHWEHLKLDLAAFKGKVILTHFSARYTERQITEFYEREVRDHFPNVTIL